MEGDGKIRAKDEIVRSTAEPAAGERQRSNGPAVIAAIAAAMERRVIGMA